MLKKINGFLCRVRDSFVERMRTLSPEMSPFKINLQRYYSVYHSQGGFISTGVLVGVFVGVIMLVLLITYLWQNGIPAVIEATSNTTALEDAGATAAQVNWATWIGGAIVIFLFVAALIVGARAMGIGSSGGGYRRRRKK